MLVLIVVLVPRELLDAVSTSTSASVSRSIFRRLFRGLPRFSVLPCRVDVDACECEVERGGVRGCSALVFSADGDGGSVFASQDVIRFSMSEGIVGS
jgi:hypothetical protein